MYTRGNLKCRFINERSQLLLWDDYMCADPQWSHWSGGGFLISQTLLQPCADIQLSHCEAPLHHCGDVKNRLVEKEIGRPIKERTFVCVNARSRHENTKESLIRSVSLNTHAHSKPLIWQGLEPRAEFAYKMGKISWKCMKNRNL